MWFRVLVLFKKQLQKHVTQQGHKSIDLQRWQQVDFAQTAFADAFYS